MGKYIVFLLLVSISCVSCKKGMSESTRQSSKYEDLQEKADKARYNYVVQVNKKKKGAKLDHARRKMLDSQARVEKYKTTMKPNTRHRNVSY